LTFASHCMKYFTIKKDILATLSYFNLFEYPLRRNEIFRFLGHCDDYREFEAGLLELLEDSMVFKIGDFYSLNNNYKLATRRYKGNEAARITILRKANRGGAFISTFPFVRGVGISGSLSKLYADDKSDIDYFIITAANRLFIARTFLHIFKKITFLFSRQHDFCMNYFVDEAEPVIREKNIYTAAEIVTLLPIRGKITFDRFFTSNSWANSFFPNSGKPKMRQQDKRKSWVKFIVEKMLDNRFGDAVDNLLMKITINRWDKKTVPHVTDKNVLAQPMHAGKHFFKQNPALLQKKILTKYDKSLSDVFSRYEISRSFLTGNH
jgi:hypothetical protein